MIIVKPEFATAVGLAQSVQIISEGVLGDNLLMAFIQRPGNERRLGHTS